ncbi:MAG TPA: hypothetical protein ENI23_05495 [bacterium]|nr:hypothetical protein [bacterium]
MKLLQIKSDKQIRLEDLPEQIYQVDQSNFGPPGAGIDIVNSIPHALSVVPKNISKEKQDSMKKLNIKTPAKPPVWGNEGTKPKEIGLDPKSKI